MHDRDSERQRDESYLKTLSILYVEDEREIREQLEQILQRRCARVFSACDGRQGLQAFERYQPDMVVTDILMPLMDGLEMGAAIRRQSPGTPLVITTAFEEPRYFKRAVDLGVDMYVTKPVTPELLLDALLKCARAVRAEAALREVEERYGLLFHVSHTALLVFDAPQRTETPETVKVVECNPAFLKLVAAPGLDQLHQDRLLGLIAPEQREMVASLIRSELMAQGFTREFEMELLRHPDGRTPVTAQLLLRRDRDGVPMEGLAVLRDLTERRRAEEQLRLAAGVFSQSHDAIMITDELNRIVSVNPAFSELTGYTAEEVTGLDPRVLKSGRQDEEFYRLMWAEIETRGHWQGEIWNRRKNGEIYPEWLSISVLKDEQGTVRHHIGVFSDISKLKAATEHIEFLAHYDPLTRLPNRLLLKDRIHQVMSACQRQRRRAALLFLDLDRFKLINDSLGHATGDRLLVQVAQRLRDTVRESDTVARLGGDEFIVVLQDVTSVGDVSRVVHKILGRLGGAYMIDRHQLIVTPSIGISLYPDDGGDFDTLLRNADSAMYAAKRAGRNHFRYFTPRMNAGAMERLALETHLRRAQDNREFRLHYQLKVALDSGRIVGLEALLRWYHPELGSVSPERFIPLAEETGLIVPIGEWALQAACRQTRRWQEEGLPTVPVAVNLSALQLRQPGLCDAVVGALSAHRLDARWLKLELTESMLMADAAGAAATLAALRDAGVLVCIDDFGTGYSSLSHLKQLPIDTLKIDKSFVRDITHDRNDAAIVSAVISMAHDLELKVLAEGVETMEQLLFLRARQCDEAQGYFFCRPLAAQEIAPLLKRGCVAVS